LKNNVKREKWRITGNERREKASAYGTPKT
jgi:hypothetical protein